MAETNIKKFLDQGGVSVLWSKVVEKITADVSAEATIARAAENANAQAAAAAQKTADDLATLVGSIPTDDEGAVLADTVIEYIDKKTEGIATDAALAELQGKVTTIENDYLTSADKTELSNAIAAEAETARAAEKANADEIARVDAALKLAVENDVAGIDSIKELATWINTHGEQATAMSNAITALETKTELGVNSEGDEYATVKAYVEAMKAASDSHANDVANTAETNAKAYADSLASNYDASGAAAAAESAAKAYADSLASNYDASGSAAAAESAAKAYADSLANNYDASGAAAEALAEAKAYTDAHAIALTVEDIEAAIAEATKNNSDN
jgi:hypothetical protein